MKKLLYSLYAVIFSVFIQGCTSEREQASELVVYCAAGLRQPIEKLAKLYESQYDVNIALNFGGSGELLSKIQLSGGDVYIPADSSYIQKAEEENVVYSSIPFWTLTAVLMVKKDNPLGIVSLKDLTRSDVRVITGDSSAAIGKLTNETLQKVKLLDGIQSGHYSTQPTVSAVATQVSLGAGDVGIVWDLLESQYPSSTFIRLPEFETQKKIASLSVIKRSKNKASAEHFIGFIGSNQKEH